MATATKQNMNEPSALDKLRAEVRSGLRTATAEDYAAATYADMLAEDQKANAERKAKAEAERLASLDLDLANALREWFDEPEGRRDLGVPHDAVFLVRGEEIPDDVPAYMLTPTEATKHSGGGTINRGAVEITTHNGAPELASNRQWRQRERDNRGFRGIEGILYIDRKASGSIDVRSSGVRIGHATLYGSTDGHLDAPGHSPITNPSAVGLVSTVVGGIEQLDTRRAGNWHYIASGEAISADVQGGKVTARGRIEASTNGKVEGLGVNEAAARIRTHLDYFKGRFVPGIGVVEAVTYTSTRPVKNGAGAEVEFTIEARG